MISDVDLMAALPSAGIPTPARPGSLALVLTALMIGTVVAVDPAGWCRRVRCAGPRAR